MDRRPTGRLTLSLPLQAVYLWSHLRFPKRLLTFIQNELYRRNLRVLNRWSKESIEERLRSEHGQTHMKPDHFSLCVCGEAFACRTELGWSDEYYVGRKKFGLYGLKDYSDLPDSRVGLFCGAISSQVPNEQQSNKDNRDCNKNSLIDKVEQMHHDRNDGSNDAGYGLPIKSVNAVNRRRHDKRLKSSRRSIWHQQGSASVFPDPLHEATELLALSICPAAQRAVERAGQ